MRDKKANGKYANKTPVMRFIHKNTGWIIMFCGLASLAGFWMYSQTESDFYHSWTCAMLRNYEAGGASFKGIMYDELSEEQKLEYSEFTNTECPLVINLGNSTP